MDKELLILDKDNEVIFFQSILSETRLTENYLVVFKPLKPDTVRRSLTLHKLFSKGTVVAWLALSDLFV